MSVIATVIEPHRVTRVIFDAHDLAIGDQRRIEQAIERSLAEADDDEGMLLNRGPLGIAAAGAVRLTRWLEPADAMASDREASPGGVRQRPGGLR